MLYNISYWVWSDRASQLQKMLDDAEFSNNVRARKSQNPYAGKSGGMGGLPNSCRANKLRSELYDEPGIFDSD